MTVVSRSKFGWRSFSSSIQYYVPALIVVAAVAISVVYANFQNDRLRAENLRSSVTESLSQIRTSLDSEITSNLHLIQGLVAALEAENGEITHERFTAIAQRIFAQPSGLRHLILAPDLIIRDVYPYRGNESLVGQNYRDFPKRYATAKRARETGQVVVTGPVPLMAGGHGLLINYPVVHYSTGASRTFWGLLTATIDIEKLYANAGLDKQGLGLDIAIVASGTAEMPTRTIYGDVEKVRDQPVIMELEFGNEHWRIFAVPTAGWSSTTKDTLLFKAIAALVCGMIVGPVLWVASLLRERHNNLAAIRQREEELRALSHRLEIALEASQIGVWELDIVSGTLDWDGRMHALYGKERQDERGNQEFWRERIHPEDLEKTERLMNEAIKTGRDLNYDFRIICPSGEIRHIRTYGTVYRDAQFRKKLVGVNWNVSSDVRLQEELRNAKLQAETHNRELEQAREHMEYNSLHDALTDLPNRRYLDQYLRQKDEQQDEKASYTLLHLDLDRFKEINDTLGHGAGDEILRQTSLRLRENIRSCDFAARIGGDEFVVVCAATGRANESQDLAKRLIDAINAPVYYDENECRVGASIGIASRTNADDRSDQVLVNADIALYEAKRRGRNRVEHYVDTMRSLAVDAKRMNDAILRSVEQNDFIAYFQPQFDARSLEIVGVEALVRWDHPDRGLLEPGAFLKAAEELNVIAQIDASILDQALLQRARWIASGVDIPKVSVNISAQRLFDEMLIEHLKEMHVLPGTLSFELLESISFDDRDTAADATLARIKALGIDIEIDDFGTGYASILSLLKLSPRRLKIDRQLTRPIIESQAQRHLISSIVDIGRSLSIEIIAEGAETMEHARILRDLGCHTLQGYALARPMSATDFLEFAQARTWFPPTMKNVG